MKRIFFVLMLVVMLSMTTIVSYVSASPDDFHRKRTPTPPPTATSASVTLAAPTLIAPENNTTVHTGNLTFVWSSVPGAARYHIQAGGIIEYWGLTSTSYTFNVTPGFVIYFPHLYWRVQAIDANNVQGPWSEWSVINLVSP